MQISLFTDDGLVGWACSIFNGVGELLSALLHVVRKRFSTMNECMGWSETKCDDK